MAGLTAADYIRELFDPQDRVAVVLISRTEDRIWQRIIDAGEAASDKYQGFFRYRNARELDPAKPHLGRPWDVYIGMNRLHPHARGRTKEHIAEVKHVFMDVDKDGPAVLDKLFKHPALEPPNYVLETSPGKFQAVWRVKDFDLGKAETLCRNMARGLGADEAVWDVARVLRLPGFKYQKNPELNHYVKLERIRDGVVGPEAFPREFFDRDREHERGERNGRARGPQRTGGSQSERDGGYACNALRKGREPQEVAAAIDAYRAGEKYPGYGKRTVEWAMRQSDVIEARQKLAHERTR